jgi:hypothetical protein
MTPKADQSFRQIPELLGNTISESVEGPETLSIF